jgi:predicted DCC family thiol-disulfide oxidoreductase YuxK
VNDDRPIIVFDAMCVLCSAHAQFVLRHDRHARFRLASVQGTVGRALYRQLGLDSDDPETIIVVEGAKCRRDNDAVIAVWEGFGGAWRTARFLRLVPTPVRDSVYRWIARNRYRLFGKRETCWVPAVADAERLL